MRLITILGLLPFCTTLAWGQFGPGVQITSEFAFPDEIMTADLDGDLDLDLVMRNDGAVVWSRNLGQGSFGAVDTLYTSNWSLASWFTAFDLADVDMDGAIDVVVLDRQDSLVVWLPNVDGLGSFGPAQLIADLHGHGDLGAIRCTNIMGDVFPDMMVNTGTFSNLSVYINDGGTFTTVDSFNANGLGGALSRVLVIGDLDLNGTNDVVHQHWSGQVWAMLNSGGALSSWTDTMLIAFAGGANFYGAGQLQLIDTEDDGDLDVADAANDNTPVWAEGFAVDSGGFHSFAPRFIGAPVPYDHTGWVAHLGCGNTASALWSSGPDGDTLNWSVFDAQLDAFGPRQSWASEPGIQLIRTADFNGDGTHDLLLAHSDSMVTWYPNQLPASNTATIELTPFDTLCFIGDPYALEHALPAGGTWSGEGVAGNLFTPPGPGSITLTYQVTDAGSGCSMAASQTITSVFEPVITLVSGNPDECALDPLMHTASPSGGIWSGIAAADGSVDRSCAARPISGPVSYAMNAVNGGSCSTTMEPMSFPSCYPANLGEDTFLCANGDTLVVSSSHYSTFVGFDTIVYADPTAWAYFYAAEHAVGQYELSVVGIWPGYCPGHDSVVVTVVEPPVVTLVAPVAVDIDGGPVNFDGGTPLGGWYVIDGVASATVDPASYEIGDSIMVVYSYTESSTGCVNSDTAYVLVEQITSISAETQTPGIYATPNPASGRCAVHFNGGRPDRIALLDALGRTVRTWPAQRTPAWLDLSGLPGGSYLIVVESPIGSLHQRMVIE